MAASAPPTRLQFAAGIVAGESAYSQPGRWIDGDKVRFVDTLPEKIGGWAKWISDSQISGTGRSLHGWQDAAERKIVAVGTHRKLQYALGGVYFNITPRAVLRSATLSNKISTTNGDETVNIEHTNHGLLTDDMVVLDAESLVGGLTILGSYRITVVDANNYTIEAALPATSTASNGGGTLSYQYFRELLGTDPISTTNGSDEVVIAHAGHGRSVGDTVYFDGATAVGGLTIDGEYLVVSAGANDYTIEAASAAASTATGGGSGVSVSYEISPGLADQVAASGWGVGAYGEGTYGTVRSSSVTLYPRVWSLDNRYDVLIAQYRGGNLYQWLYGDTHATPVLNAPENNSFAFVASNGAIVVVGADGDRRSIVASDSDDITTWESANDNSAWSDRISKDIDLVGYSKLLSNSHVLAGPSRCFILQFTGDDLVFDLRDAGGLAGPISLLSICEFKGVAYWMGAGDFYKFDGTLQTLNSADIHNYVFKDINLNQSGKFFAGVNVAHNEIWFFYCSSGSDEIDRYVAYDIDDNCWIKGTMARMAWMPMGLYTKPLAIGTDAYVYEHESGLNADGSAMRSYIKSAPVDIADGGRLMDIEQIIPDFQRITGTVNVTLYPKDKPNSSEGTDGPFAVTSATEDFNPRTGGRQVAIQFESNEVGGDFRLGVFRATVKAAGRRA